MANFSKNLGKSANLWQKTKNEINRKIRQQEVSDTVRESRSGFRGFGLSQLNTYSLLEGSYVVGIGGPPVAGR